MSAKKQPQRGAFKIPEPNQKKDRKTTKKAPTDRRTVKQLLGEFYTDKEYFDTLLADRGLKRSSKRNANNRNVRERARDGLEYLNVHADFWRQFPPEPRPKRRKPRPRPVRPPSRPLSRESSPVESVSPPSSESSAVESVTSNMQLIEEANSDGRYQDSLDLATTTLTIIDQSSENNIQNKPQLLTRLHRFMGNAYLELEEFDQAIDHHEKVLDIAKQYGLDEERSWALDNVGRIYARKGAFEKAIDVWQDKIPFSKSALESTWLYHEIGRCYMELGKHMYAREYAHQSLEAAIDGADDEWQIHATILVAQCEVNQRDYPAAANSFEKCLKMAQQRNDEATQEVIQTALDNVNDRIARRRKPRRQLSDNDLEREATNDTTVANSDAVQDGAAIAIVDDGNGVTDGTPIDIVADDNRVIDGTPINTATDDNVVIDGAPINTATDANGVIDGAPIDRVTDANGVIDGAPINTATDANGVPCGESLDVDIEKSNGDEVVEQARDKLVSALQEDEADIENPGPNTDYDVRHSVQGCEGVVVPTGR